MQRNNKKHGNARAVGIFLRCFQTLCSRRQCENKNQHTPQSSSSMSPISCVFAKFTMCKTANAKMPILHAMRMQSFFVVLFLLFLSSFLRQNATLRNSSINNNNPFYTYTHTVCISIFMHFCGQICTTTVYKLLFMHIYDDVEIQVE